MATQDELNKELLQAVQEGDLARVRTAIEKGADAACVTAAVIPPQEETDAHFEVMRYLFTVGTNANDPDFEEGTLMQFSTYRKQMRYLQLYLDAGADINLAHAASGVTGLHTAVLFNLPDFVRFYLDAGADANLACHADAPTSDPGHVYGETALHFAAANADRDIIEMLLAAGADKTAKSARGETPLDYAQSPHRGLPIQPKAPAGEPRSEDILQLLR